MSSTLYLIDDRSLIALMDAAPSGQHVQLCGAMTRLVTDGCLAFPPEVAKDVQRKADPEDDARLLIWLDAIRPSMTYEASYQFKKHAQSWAVANGYDGGLDPIIAGTKGTCVTAVVACLLEHQRAGTACTVVTGDTETKPSRVALGEVCAKLGVACITPKVFFADVLSPLMPTIGT